MDSYEVHYVRHEDIERFERNGWYVVQTLARTHHGNHAVLMRRDEKDKPVPDGQGGVA